MYWKHIDTADDGPSERCDAVSTLCGEKLYVAGGWCGSQLRTDTWWLDLTTRTWHGETPRNDGPERITGHTSTFWDGRTLVSWAGHGEALYHNKLWIYDARRSGWTEQTVKYQNQYRKGYGQENVGSFDPTHGPVVFGGDDGCYSQRVQQLDLRNNSWLLGGAKGTVPSARHSHSCTMDTAGKMMYITGGHDGRSCSDVHRLDLSTVTFERVSALGKGLAPVVSPATTYSASRLHVFGGMCGGNRYSTTSVLDMKSTPAFRDVPVSHAPPGRAYHTVCSDPAVADSHDTFFRIMVVFGGHDGSKYLKDLHILQSG